MAISGVFGLRNLQKLQITIKFPDEIYCNIPTQLTLQLSTGHRYLPHYLLTLIVRDSQALFHLLRPESRQEKRISVTFVQRGMTTLDKVAVSSPFPVNFFVRSNIYKVDESCLVFPEPLPLAMDRRGETAVATGSRTDRRRGSSTDTESIGVYTKAEPLKQIHWKLSARHNELLVKEMSAESGKPLIIELDELPGGIEQRLGHAAFLVNALIAEGRAVGLKTGTKTVLPEMSKSHRLKLLVELASHAAD